MLGRVVCDPPVTGRELGCRFIAVRRAAVNGYSHALEMPCVSERLNRPVGGCRVHSTVIISVTGACPALQRGSKLLPEN